MATTPDNKKPATTPDDKKPATTSGDKNTTAGDTPPSGFLKKIAADKDFPSKLVITLVDKLVLGAAIVGLGYFVNAKLERLKRIEGQRAAITKTRLDTLVSAHEKLRNTFHSLVDYDAGLRKTICAHYSDRATYDAFTPAFDNYKETNRKINEALAGALLIDQELAQPVANYKLALIEIMEALDGRVDNNQRGLVACAMQQPTPPPFNCADEAFIQWIHPCVEPLAKAMGDGEQAEIGLAHATNDLIAKQLAEE